MFAPVIATAQVRFSAETAGIESAADKIGKSIRSTVSSIVGIAVVATAVFLVVRRVFNRLRDAYEDSSDPLNGIATSLAGLGSAARDGLEPVFAFVRAQVAGLAGDADENARRFKSMADAIKSAMLGVSEVAINIGTVLMNLPLAWGLVRDSAIGSFFAVRDAASFVFGKFIPEAIENVIDTMPLLATTMVDVGSAVVLVGKETFGWLFSEYIPQLVQNAGSILTNFGSLVTSSFRAVVSAVSGDMDTAISELSKSATAMAGLIVDTKIDFALSDEATRAVNDAASGVLEAWEKIKPQAEFTLSDEAKNAFSAVDRGLIKFDQLFQQNREFLNAQRDARASGRDMPQLSAGFSTIEQAFDKVQQQLFKQDTEKQQLGELQRLNAAAARIEGKIASQPAQQLTYQ